MTRYINWIREAPNIEKSRLIYMDESHFVDRDLFKTTIAAPSGKRAHVVRSGRLDTSLSLSLLINLKKRHPFYFEFREQSNTSIDFFKFIITAIKRLYWVWS